MWHVPARKISQGQLGVYECVSVFLKAKPGDIQQLCQRGAWISRGHNHPCGLDGGSSPVGRGQSQAVGEAPWHITGRQSFALAPVFLLYFSRCNSAIVLDAGHRLRFTKLKAALLSTPPPKWCLCGHWGPCTVLLLPRPTLDCTAWGVFKRVWLFCSL